jgi:hypothetical protein
MLPLILDCCPECGHWNADDPQRCERCDEPLRLPYPGVAPTLLRRAAVLCLLMTFLCVLMTISR